MEATFQARSDDGARKCLDALALLEYDIYTKHRFCAEGEQAEPVIHALRWTTPIMLTMAKRKAEEEALTLRLNTLITNVHGEFQF